jgi:hypothetical protein
MKYVFVAYNFKLCLCKVFFLKFHEDCIGLHSVLDLFWKLLGKIRKILVYVEIEKRGRY